MHVVFAILSSSSSSLGSLAHERRAAGKLFIQSSARLSVEFIPLCVGEHRKLVRAMANFWLSCTLAVSRTPFAMAYYNRLQLAALKTGACRNDYDRRPHYGHTCRLFRQKLVLAVVSAPGQHC